MPLARIDLPAGQSAGYRGTIGEVVYNAMISVLDVPKDDRFQIISKHSSGGLVIDPAYLGIERTKDAIVIQVTLSKIIDL